MTTQQLWDAAWLASLPPAIVAMMQLSNETARTQQAETLAGLGYSIDVPTMVWLWDWYQQNGLRQAYGYTWTPALGQPNITVAPGLNVPGQIPYNPAAPPPGSIPVITDISQLKPYAPAVPVVPPPTQTASPVGALCLGSATIYSGQPWDTFANGAMTGAAGIPADPRGTFTKTLRVSAFGMQGFWTLTTPASPQQ